MIHSISRVTTKEQRTICKEFINTFHSYIKYADRPSRKMYYLLYEDSILVGVFALGSVYNKSNLVKHFMLKHSIAFNEAANNIVCCFHGCKDKNAGTKFLKLLRVDAKVWWKERYKDNLKAFQTFILPPRNGALYKADNWVLLGETKGKVQTVKTLYGEDRDKHPEAEIRTFKNGEVKYLLREYAETEKKLIFMRLI